MFGGTAQDISTNKKEREIKNKYYKWYESEYSKCVHLDTLAERHPQVAALAKGFEHGYSSIWRHECLANMKYFAGLRKIEYNVTALSIHRQQTKAAYRTIYGFIYSYFEKGKPVHEYVSSCPTFKSMDGEYRHRFITVHQFNESMKVNVDAFTLIREHVVKSLKDGDVTFMMHTSNTEDDDKLSKAIEKSISSAGLDLLSYCAAWLIDYNRFSNGWLENHLADGYVQAMFGKADAELQAQIVKLKVDRLALQRYKKSKDQRLLVLELGQKLIPLTVTEVEECENIQYTPWREAYIASLVGDLVINGAGPMFPILNDWFFVVNSTTSFYDNPVNHIRAKYSEEAMQLVKDLEQVRQKTYVVDPVQKKELYLSYNMEGLSETIQIPMEFAESQLVQSNIALLTITEHIGRTLGDLRTMLADKTYSKMHGPMFADFSAFSKYVFEFVYGVYCLNYHYGCIHTDLHLNNGTTFVKRPLYDLATHTYEIEKAKLIYEVNDKLYLFSHYGAYSAIIDFSRALLSRKYIKEHFDPKKVSDIMLDQKARILRTYEQNLPDFYTTHQTQLEQALILNYDAVHRLVEAVDVHKIALGWEHIITELQANPEQLKAFGDATMLKNQALPLIKKLQNQALGYLTTQMQKVLAAPTKADYEQIPHPNLSILEECFAEFVIPKAGVLKQEGTLVDYHRLENELTYNVREYEKFPPTVKLDYVKEHKVPGELEAVVRFRTYEDYLKSGSIEEKIEEVVDSVRETLVERRGMPEELAEAESKKPTKDEVKKQEQALASSANDYYYES